MDVPRARGLAAHIEAMTIEMRAMIEDAIAFYVPGDPEQSHHRLDTARWNELRRQQTEAEEELARVLAED